MRPRVHSEKRIVQSGINETNAGSVRTIVIANAVQNSSALTEVDAGCTISAVQVEMWLLATQQQPGSITVTLEKMIGDATDPTFTQMATLDTYVNKKNIFYTTQGITGDANSNPIPFVRDWFKIPKGKQRFGLGDSLKLHISANLENVTSCGKFIYKEQT